MSLILPSAILPKRSPSHIPKSDRPSSHILQHSDRIPHSPKAIA
ncbi:hypothetical protein [Nodularia spumigena]|uniref:Uncharacterized protein n=1 Tax=Nodularia spumigena UHCC 0060 TaxID=3110300 RepID=A0ABU5UXA1_NODSP|nr:hypothetical protein [Nodularia spumigena]AHJ29048.1 hypothetical protein NSP_27200 [Nodularia spumigena CCY9414]MEA5557343.1 hypothetical protein [Nodularia spumigena CH309]MEA5610155.1 hypothetical protein [Nodularia spumigena UHCC 0060]